MPDASTIADRAQTLLSGNTLYPGDLHNGRILFCRLVSLDTYSNTNITSFVPLVRVVDQLLSVNHSTNWRQLDIDDIGDLLACTESLSKMAVQSVGGGRATLGGDNINMSLAVSKQFNSDVDVSQDGNAVAIPHNLTDGELMMMQCDVMYYP